MKKTACKKCKHIKRSGHDIWYNHYCEAAKPYLTFDSFTGEYESRLQYCRDVNKNGCCDLFEQR